LQKNNNGTVMVGMVQLLMCNWWRKSHLVGSKSVQAYWQPRPELKVGLKVKA